MSETGVRVGLDRQPADYLPGDELNGSLDWQGDAEAVELSVLWHTAGWGAENFGVHHFERTSPDEAPGAGRQRRFATRLPPSPLSYDGLVVKVCWCVRVRVFLRQGGELVGEAPFRLSTVSPARDSESGATGG
jgi:hypothetical protein